MDPELYLLYQSQLCTLIALHTLMKKTTLLGSQTPADAVTLNRLDEQIRRLREKGVSL